MSRNHGIFLKWQTHIGVAICFADLFLFNKLTINHEMPVCWTGRIAYRYRER